MNKKSILVGAVALSAFTMGTTSTFAKTTNNLNKIAIEATCANKSNETKSTDATCGDKKADAKAKDATCGDKKAKAKSSDKKMEGKCGEGKYGGKKMKKAKKAKK